MRITYFIPAALFLGLVACNNAGDKPAASASDTSHPAPAAANNNDTMNMSHNMDTSGSGVPALPAVPAGAKVFFKNLKDGQTVTSPFKVEMGVEGFRIDSAGAIVDGSGHHHLLIDAGDSIPAGQVVPKDATHIHFGKAQTSTDVTLPAGKHVLTLQCADGIHRSYGSKLAATITVNVK